MINLGPGFKPCNCNIITARPESIIGIANPQRMTVVNVPSDIGSMIKGKHLAPAAFQSANFIHKLVTAGFEVNEVDALSSSTPPTFITVVGGECNMVPAVMSALWTQLATKRISVLYVDADADLVIPSDPGPSGNLASMTFTQLTMKTRGAGKHAAFRQTGCYRPMQPNEYSHL